MEEENLKRETVKVDDNIIVIIVLPNKPNQMRETVKAWVGEIGGKPSRPN